MKRIAAMLLALCVLVTALPAMADVYEDAGFLKKIPPFQEIQAG